MRISDWSSDVCSSDLRSLAAGEIVTAAAIPPGALSGVPKLGDFAATANALHPVDPNAYETLQSSRHTASLAIGVTRPIGDFSASLNLNASRNSRSEERRVGKECVRTCRSRWSPDH